MNDSIKKRRENLLRSLYSSKSGLIVHCSAVFDSGSVFAFTGEADAGKSTLAEKLSNIMPVINDDMNIFEFYDNGCIKVSTYFTHDEDQGYHYIINGNLSGTLKAVLFPVKEVAKTSSIKLIEDKGAIWTTLLKCVAPPLKNENELFQNYLEMLDRLMDHVPFFNIYHNLKDSPELLADVLHKKNEKDSA